MDRHNEDRYNQDRYNEDNHNRNNYNLDSLDAKKIAELIKKREAAIASASSEMNTQEYPANKLAEALHPKRQYLEVAEVICHDGGCKTFILKPDVKRGTTDCAYFNAGQYLSVSVEIDGKMYSRPYSIVSSPKEALSGKYAITVKAVEGGIVSNFILENWKTGMAVETSAPEGQFYIRAFKKCKTCYGSCGRQRHNAVYVSG